MALVFDKFWGVNVNQYIVSLMNARNLEVRDLPRDEILRLAKYLGWPFTDSLDADWSSDSKAEAFIRRFISSWSQYTATKERPTLASYLSFLLSLPITMHIMYSNAYDPSYDGILDDVLDLELTSPPTFSEISYGDLVRFEDLPAGWQTIHQNPTSGWYPTSHVELEITAADLPNSGVPNVTPEQLLTELFYVIAPIQYVLKNISIQYDTETQLHINTGFFVEEEYY
jgi:hypothetical protein